MRRTMAEIQQVDVVRLAWVDMNNGTETIFKPTDCNISRVTLKLIFPILILVYRYYTTQSQSTDMPLTVGQYSTDSQAIFHRHLALPVLAEFRLVYRPTYQSVNTRSSVS